MNAQTASHLIALEKLIVISSLQNKLAVLQSRFSTLMKVKQSLQKKKKPLNSTKHTNAAAEVSKSKKPQKTCDANNDDNKTGKVE